MKRSTLPNRRASRRALRALIWAVALMIVACDTKVKFSPTAPPTPGITPVGDRSLMISGNLLTAGGSMLGATILYDGRELAGARATCPDPGGCAELELGATTPSGSGQHVVSFQLLRQSSEAASYLATGTVLVSRAGLPLGGVTINLGPTSAMLRSGESVSFDIDFRD